MMSERLERRPDGLTSVPRFAAVLAILAIPFLYVGSGIYHAKKAGERFFEKPYNPLPPELRVYTTPNQKTDLLIQRNYLNSLEMMNLEENNLFKRTSSSSEKF